MAVHGITRKIIRNILKETRTVAKEEPKGKRSPLTLHLKIFIDPRRPFYRQRTPKVYPCKERIDIILKFGNSDRKVKESIRIRSGPHTRTRKGTSSTSSDEDLFLFLEYIFFCRCFNSEWT